MKRPTPLRAHVVGAGLAGLSAAVALVRGGAEVTVSEAAAQAGGRCRSYFDRELGLVIDNGNHLVLSGNRAVTDYLETIGATDRLAGPATAEFPYVDLRDDLRWTLRPNAGPIAWWVFDRSRRVPGTRAGDYLALLRLLAPPRGARVRDVVAARGVLWERMLENFLVAVLNTEAADASAALAASVVRETLARGGARYLPRVATPTLSAAFVDPALDWLGSRGVEVRLGRRLRAIEFGADRVDRLVFADGAIDAADVVVLATPAAVARDLAPGLDAPDQFRAILNAHYAFTPPPAAPIITGVIGGLAEWVFALPDRISVTVSAADRLMDADRADLAARLWADVVRVLALPGGTPMPRWQVVKERRATFAATPEQDQRRPTAATRWRNLWLAGDWTATGLPSTIEGSLRSGTNAAGLALASA